MATHHSTSRFWAILCNPNRYDIEAAVRALHTDTWNLPSGDPEPGDGIVIWKARGNGAHRGIVALGEVCAAPAVVPPEPGSEPYWVGQPELERKRRIRLRYDVPPMAPLWLGGGRDNVLNQLSVARGQGNKLYKVTRGQWNEIVEALRGSRGQELQEQTAGAALDEVEKAHAQAVGQGFAPSPERRAAIERHAMKAAENLLESRNYSVKDTSKDSPYDFVAVGHGETLYVEVKGTTAGGDQVFLTRNEIAHAKAHPRASVLLILHDIAFNGPDTDLPGPSGGTLKILWPWKPEDEDLVALSYRYQVP